jgi:hypothetical protein
MAVDRVKFQDIVSSQLPDYVKEDFPLLTDFLQQYYVSQEFQSGTYDLVQNLDQYVKVDELFNLKTSTVLLSDISYGDTTIETSEVGNFTQGFSDTNGLIKIGDEIIRYEYKTDSSFVNCTRGFSGITSYIGTNTPDELVFSTSEANTHSSGATIYNLNILFLQQFFKKVKYQFTPGFTERQLYSGLDQRNFVFNADSFYKSKGTDQSFEILFRALYGEDVDVIKPAEYLLRPSNADYKITQDIVVEQIQGDPLQLKNLTLFQDATGARGSVTDVEQIQYDQGQYYQVSIDFGYQRDIDVTGSIFSEFEPNSQTKILTSVSAGSTIIDADSTVGFADTGKLVAKDVDNNIISIQYLDKNDNQFLNVSGVSTSLSRTTDIRFDDYSYAYAGINTSDQIQVRITSTLKNLSLNEKTYLYKKGDTIKVQSLGLEDTSERSKNWLANIQTKWNIESVTLVDAAENSYQFETYDPHFLKEQYSVLVEDVTNSSNFTGNVISVRSSTSFIARLTSSINVSHTFVVENQLLKGNSGDYPQLNKYVANVQNTYGNFEGDAIVASNSIPRYSVETNPYDKKINISGTYQSTELLNLTTTTDHGLYTGDAVWYKSSLVSTTTTNADGIKITTTTENKFEDIDVGIYYVKRENSTQVRLSRSKADLFSGKYLTFNGTVTNNKIIYYDYYLKTPQPQKIYRSILPPVNKSGDFGTVPGFTGILINGVEILNYKSIDTIKYGDIQSIDISRGGQNYDVINPPVLQISDTVGTGATGACCVSGVLERIDIINTGFDYVETPTVSISGGNGKNAAAEVNTSAIIHRVDFVAISTAGVDVSADTIGFSTSHNFAQGERVIYDAGKNTKVGGLSTEASYYVGVVDNSTIKLYTSVGDANVGVSTVNLTSLGTGVQSLQSATRKNVVTSIVVTNPGSGYENKQRTIPTAGISTALNQFTITNHGYKSKEIVRYSGTDVAGLSTNKDYYVVKVDNNTFSLSEVGVGSTATDYYYNNGILVDITSEGSGSFNYQPITVSVNGATGISTRAGQNFNAVVQPVFRGSIQSVDLTSTGTGYGSSEIINFNRQPDITFNSGTGAVLVPVVNNGRITSILINNGGTGYNSPPDITINSDTGNYAALTPILRNGRIVEVKIIKSGIGYVPGETTITVTAAGVGAIADANIRSWNINLFSRNFVNFESDDGILDQNIDDTSLQYSHLYAPRKLRETIFAISGNNDDNTLYGTPDLVINNNSEVSSVQHSPIIGWAYDGNPIYGPYGYANASSGSVTRMTSGYTEDTTATNRPPVTIYPAGFFVEDFTFTGNGSLDEHNGRFCVTPDYPNGVYAYFATINSIVDSSGPFKNYRRPVFPYLIGDTYKSVPNDFNFKLQSNQNDYDIEKSGLLRNTANYHTNDVKSGYDYIFNSTKVQDQSIDITATSVGSIESVGILTGGTNYKVNDKVSFRNEGTGGRDADVKVFKVAGKTINQVSLATTSFYNVEFIRNGGSYLAFAAEPHDLKQNDIVQISGISTYFKGFNGSYTVGIRSDNFVLTLGVGNSASTGLVTYFYVSGALQYPHIRPNDILNIGTEKVKVLNVDAKTQRIRVLRGYEGTTGVAHTSREILLEDPRKFRANIGGLTTTKAYYVNEELYFDPAESVGLGTVLGTGVGTTITFSNPGVGATQVFVEPRAIYYPDHNLNLNDTVSYDTNGGTPISVWNGVTGTAYTSLSEFSTLYAVPLSGNFIGISSNKVGLSSTGYVGVNTSLSLLYFASVGTGNTHSFTTNLDSVISGQVSQNIVTVSTATTHGLQNNDTVTISVKPTTERVVDVRYNDYNRRIVFDPRDFAAGDVDTALNTIGFGTEYFSLGDRVIHTSSSPSGGLANQKMYYVIPYNETKVRLVEEEFELSAAEPNYVDITSASSGTLSKINPLVKPKRNETLTFDLSDSSLSFISNGISYSAFDFNLYTDKEFTTQFLTSGATSTFEVTKTGNIGVDATANVKLFVSDYIPTNLYYEFTPTNLDIIPDFKKEISIDNTIPNFSEIEAVKTSYDGTYNVSGVGTTTFTYNVPTRPEVSVYTSANSKSSYVTNSRNTSGPIAELKIFNGGYDYQSLPGISSVISGLGSGAILKPASTSVGNILNTQFNNIGFDYPTDETVRAVANLPEVLKMNPLTSFERIGIVSQGLNYLVSPDLIVIDGYTKEVVSDIDLRYNLGDTEVDIVNNTFGIYNTPPTILPINNSNGIGIASVSFISASKTVRLVLDQQFSDAAQFPYVTGEKILVENLSVGVGTSGRGYNSSDYNYNLFEVTDTRPNLGGSGAWIEYSLSEFLSGSEIPGNVDILNSAGRAIPESHFPIFEPVLQPNNYYENEKVTSGTKVGVVGRWNPLSEYLYLTTPKEFSVGDRIIGQSSNTQGVVESKIEFKAEIKTGAGATVVDGWQTNSGFLNDNFQRMPNNEYYQNLSYSLKSKIPFGTWDDPVSALNHTAGFAKFADLIVESIEDTPQGITRPEDSNVETVVDIIGVGRLNCFHDFDEVSEVTANVGGKLVSDEIIFDNRILSDYFESIGNRVLYIDDVSSQFNSIARPDPFLPAASFASNATYNRVFALTQDKNLSDEKQAIIISVLQNDNVGYIQQYADVDTGAHIGDYEYVATDSGFDIMFYPVDYEFTEYDISSVSFTIFDNLTGIGSTNIGDVVFINSFHTDVAAATTTTIASIGTTFRSSKVLVQIDNGGQFSASEINLIHDGTDVYTTEFGDLYTGGTSGFGTFSPYISGSNINIDFIPSVATACTANVNVVSIADTSVTGISSVALDPAIIQSYQTNIAASGSPTANVIASYHSPIGASYFIVSVEDLTNSQYEMFEAITVDAEVNDDGYVEFANLYTSSDSLGTVGFDTSSGGYQLTYTPIANAEMQVRVYSMQLYIYDGEHSEHTISFHNSEIETNHREYTGTLLDLKTAFGLTHDGLNIFERYFNGSDSAIVDTTNNVIKIVDHFFVTGEKVIYSHAGAGTTQAIGIATTTVPGIGSTDKLPNELFVVKQNNVDLKFASTAENALAANPVTFDLTSVGIGTSHNITATNQNPKVMVAVDNIIQSPIVSAGVTYSLDQNIVFDTTITLSGVTSIFAEDLIQINDEVMTVRSVGIGGSSNDILVRRASMGTQVKRHYSGDVVTKLGGNYNIIGNTLHFTSAPYGNTPVGVGTTVDPDQTDWSGITTSSTFQGRAFLRSGITNSTEETYTKNYVFDDISNQFTGIQSTFTLKSNATDITGFSTDNGIVLINGIFQAPQGAQPENYQRGDYLFEESGITTIRFTGGADTPYGYDPNRTDLPIGGLMVSLASTEGFGYQPLVSAGGTAVVSGLGTITSISIGNTGSGYRAGIQTIVNVGVQTLSTGVPNIEFIGTAAISGGHIVSVAITNPGAGYTSTNPPLVVFDSPLPYSDIPLIYSSDSPSGAGQSATAEITVGQGSSVVNFEITNYGYGYQNGDILTFAVGGTTGIPTDTTLTYDEFQLTVERSYSDQFNGWVVGQLEVLDSLDREFNGSQQTFSLKLNEQPFSASSAKGSNIDLEQALLVFINDILQDPRSAYEYKGGSNITFVEAPKAGDTSKFLFYKGTADIDVRFVDVLETVKVGDTLDIDNNASKGQSAALNEDARTVTGINTVDTVSTNPYSGPGVTTNRSLLRPVTWCKQLVDKVIEGKKVGKDRIEYEPQVYPSAFILKNVGTSTDTVYVDTLRPLFDGTNESTIRTFQDVITITSQDTVVAAAATAVVSTAGTVSSLVISNAGLGYTLAPSVTIANPVGGAVTATATATISGVGTVTTLTITGPGTGYTSTNAPVVLIESPKVVSEEINVSSYVGDYGIIVGVGTTTSGSQDQFYFDTFIPMDSFMRNSSLVGTAVTVSGISTTDYFTAFYTNITIGSTFASEDQNGATIGIGTTFLDCVYQVSSYEDNDLFITAGSTTGITTTCRRVFVNVDTVGSGIAYTSLPDMGEFSWGKISLDTRTNSQSFNFYGDNGYTGISTSALVTRSNSLRFRNYTS